MRSDSGGGGKALPSTSPRTPSSTGGDLGTPFLAATASEDSAECQPPPQTRRALLERWWNRSRLGLYTILLLLTSLGNTVYFKRMTSAMPNYGWYLTQLSTLMYVPFFSALAGTAIVTKIRRDLIKNFACMGIFDGLSGIFMVLGGVHTSGNSQVILSQAVIPLLLIFSMIFLKKRFHCLQHLGAAVIVFGICIAKAFAGAGAADSDTDVPVFNALFAMALAPAALSSVYKEVAFRSFDGDLDVNVLQFWVTIFQLLTNFMAIPVYALRMLGAQRVALTEMPGLTVGGSRCLFFLEDQVLHHCDLPGEKPCDHCADAWQPVVGYLAFNLLFNVFTMLVIKHGSATLSFLVSTLRMPLSAIAFGSTLIMGDEAVQPGISDLVSLVVIIVGLLAYRVGGQRLEVRVPSSAESPPASPSRAMGEMWQSPRAAASRWRFMPLFSTVTPGLLQPTFVLVHLPRPQPRTAERVRNDLYRRLGTASPLHSPKLRHLSPPNSPPPRAGFGPSAAAAAGDGDRSDAFDALGMDRQTSDAFDMTGLPPS